MHKGKGVIAEDMGNGFVNFSVYNNNGDTGFKGNSGFGKITRNACRPGVV